MATLAGHSLDTAERYYEFTDKAKSSIEVAAMLDTIRRKADGPELEGHPPIIDINNEFDMTVINNDIKTSDCSVVIERVVVVVVEILKYIET